MTGQYFRMRKYWKKIRRVSSCRAPTFAQNGRKAGNMKGKYTIFFAIPFDNLTEETYKKIASRLRKGSIHETYRCEFISMIGIEQIGPNQECLDLISFRRQNTELHEQFFSAIKSADIVVADLTNNNPNVHVELGIALSLNKNILRVTGRPFKELGFDIQNLKVHPYKNRAELLKEISRYLDRFLKLKTLEFLPKEYPELCREINSRVVPATKEDYEKRINNGQEGHRLFSSERCFSFRDGKIKLNLKFLSNCNDESWAGIFFRASDNPWRIWKQLHGIPLRFRQHGWTGIPASGKQCREFRLSFC